MLQILRFVGNRPPQRQMELKMALFASLMKWPSRFSFQILEETLLELQLCKKHVFENINLLKVIYKHIFDYVTLLRVNKQTLGVEIMKLTEELAKTDSTHELFAIRFGFELSKMEKEL